MTDERRSPPASWTTTSPSATSTSRRSAVCCSRSKRAVGRAPRSRRAVLEELFRSFHSIKGISGMVELREAEMLAHHMESYLRVLRSGEARLTDEGMDALIGRRRRAGADDRRAPRRSQPPPAIEQVVGAARRRSCPTPARRRTHPEARRRRPPRRAAWRVTFAPSAALLARGINVDSVRARLRDAGTIVDAAPRVTARRASRSSSSIAGRRPRRRHDRGAGAPTASRVEPIAGRRGDARHRAADAGRPKSAPRASPPSHVVRVDLTRLDELMRMIGDLVISRAAARRRAARASKRTCRRSSGAPSRRTRRRSSASCAICAKASCGVRLVPVGEIFRRMPFVVRDLARETGKQVRLELRGQETEIDKFLIERMMDPVLHLVRNAVSHGFEPPAERVAAGKPAEGTLTLAAASVGETVVARDRRRRPRHRRGGGGGARAGRRACRCPTGRSTTRRCSTCCARRGSRPATRPIAPAAAASAWRW